MMLKSDGFFVLPGGLDERELAQAMKGLTLRLDPTGQARAITILDCHDQSVRASGQILIEIGRSLRLMSGDGTEFRQNCKGVGRFVQDLPGGPVRDGLRGFPKLRALMEIGAARIETKSLALLDDLQKTQLRGTVTELTSDDGRVSLVRLQKLRGYDRAFGKTCAVLGSQMDGIEAVFDCLFPAIVPYQAKPLVALGTSEPSIEVAVDIIRTFLGVARQNEEGILADIDTEFLHDYRVSLRRIRSVISLFKGVFSDAQTAEFKMMFSDLMAPTGRVRDLDVYLLEKNKYFRLIPESLHAGLRMMFDRFEKERAQELTRLSRRLRSRAYETEMRDLAALLDGTARLQPGPNAARGAYEYACALIWKRYRKVCKLARSIAEDTPDEAVHDLRIDCKKLRYLMEFFAPLFDAQDFKTILKPLKKLQDNLGLFNDYSVQQEALMDFTAQHSTRQGQLDAQLGLAAGGLIAVLDQRQKAERSRVIANFQQFDSPQIRHLFRRTFHHTEE